MKTCQHCGKEFDAAAVGSGLCPECMLKVGLGSEPGTVAALDKRGGDETKPAGTTPRLASAATTAEIAKHFPQLEVLELLGQGGMGAVYKARQKQLDRMIALKILPPESGRDPAFAERFLREARALARLNHPNIVTVYEFGESDGLFYLVMEYVDGANLRQMERAQKFTPAQALAIIPKICDALQFAHDEGIVHRDIKPENILVDKKGRVKIADFGLAKLLSKSQTDYTLTGTNQAMGTPHYMAPEQMEKPLTVDHRADIYSLGVVFYEMLTGELPLGRFQPPSERVQVDVRFDEIVLRSMERDVERRYQHVSEVKTQVENIAHTPPVGVPASIGPEKEPPKGGTPTAAAPVQSSRPRLCKQAIISAVWAMMGPACAAPIFYMWLWAAHPNSPELPKPMGPMLPVLITFSLLGFSAVIGATISGAVAVSRIRQSNGQLTGLPFAAFGMVFHPMLVLFGFVASCTGLWHGWGKLTGYGSIPAIVVCFFAGRAVWRKIAQPVGVPTTASPETAPPKDGTTPGAPVNHLNNLLGFWMTPQPGFAKAVGIPMLILTGIWMVVSLTVTFRVPQEEQNVHLITSVAGWVLIPLAFLFLTLRWAVRRGKPVPPVVKTTPTWVKVLAIGLGALVVIPLVIGVLVFGLFFFRVKPSGTPDRGPVTTLERISQAMDSGFEVAQDRSQIPTTTTPGRQDYAFKFAAPAGYTLNVWVEFWKDGRLEIDPNFDERYAPARDQKLSVSVRLTTMDGNMASVESAGKTRFDWVLTDYRTKGTGTSSTGDWKADIFKNTSTFTSSWDKQRGTEWHPKPGQTITLLALCGYRSDNLGTYDLGWSEASLLKGWPNAAILLRARFDPVAPGELQEGPVTKTAATDQQNRMMTFAQFTIGKLIGADLSHVTNPADAHKALVAATAPPENQKLVKQMVWDLGAGGAWQNTASPEELITKLETAINDVTSKKRIVLGEPGGPLLIGVNGPELHNDAIKKLKLSKLQADEINQMFQKYFREYVALERRHSKIIKDEQGRIVVTIEPFSDECQALAQRLATELGGIVEFSVLPKPKVGQLPTQIFRWGGEQLQTITMWKADGKYFVEDKNGTFTFNMNGPNLAELPEQYRLFWREE